MSLFVKEIAQAGPLIRFIYSNNSEIILKPPFQLLQQGTNSTNNRVNNFYVVTGRHVRNEAKLRVRNPKFGLRVTRLNGVPFSGDFEALGDEIAGIIVDAELAAGSGVPVVVDTDDVTNVSTVVGNTATDALDTLQTLVNTINTQLSNLDSNDIINISTVLGVDVTDALDTLQTLINTLGTDDIINDSTVPGLTDTDALDFLLGVAEGLPTEVPDSQVMNANPITGTQDDYEPTEEGKDFNDVQFILLNPTNNLNIEGILAPSPIRRVIKIMYNNSTNRRIRYRNNRPSSAANNRIITNGNISVDQQECAIFIYNTVSLKWNIIALNN